MEITRHNGTNFPGAPVKKDHRLSAVAIVKKRIHGFCIGMAHDGPEPKAPNAGADGSAKERQRIRSLRLKDGQTVAAGDTEVGFEHGAVVARAVSVFKREIRESLAVWPHIGDTRTASPRRIAVVRLVSFLTDKSVCRLKYLVALH